MKKYEVLDAVNSYGDNRGITKRRVQMIFQIPLIPHHGVCADFPLLVPLDVGFSVGTEERTSLDLKLKCAANVLFKDCTFLLVNFCSRVTCYPLDAERCFNAFFYALHCEILSAMF